MKYNVSKDNYVRVLWSRPGLIKKIASLDEDTAAFFIQAVKKCYDFLPYKLQASVKVVRAYIHETPEEKKNNTTMTGVNFNLIPQHTLGQLTTKERINLIRRTYGGTIIESFIKPSYTEWLEAVKTGYSIYDVPEKFHDRKTLYIAAAKNYKNETSYPIFTVPNVFWEKNPSESLIEMLEVCPRMIHCIPPERITTWHLVAAFQTGEDLSFNEDRWREIPLSSWETKIDTVRMVLRSDPVSIRIIPEKYLTEDDALKCARDDDCTEEDIPASLLTRRVLVSLAANRNNSFSKHLDYPIYGEHLCELGFQLDVIKEGGFSAAKIMDKLILIKDYPKIIEICPEYIQLIPKLQQTDDIIDTFLGAPAEVVDNMAEHINLGKIRKQHAPLLIGCESPIILSTIEKKLKGNQKKNTQKKTPHSIEIDMAPGDFAAIRVQLEEKV